MDRPHSQPELDDDERPLGIGFVVGVLIVLLLLAAALLWTGNGPANAAGRGAERHFAAALGSAQRPVPPVPTTTVNGPPLVAQALAPLASSRQMAHS